nr:MAG TPA: Abi-like protein [Caudoviricetes sp.]
MQFKPFLTIDEQVALLNSRGVSTDGNTSAKLLREGYYSIVNGYKDPFLDAEATASAGDDRYLADTEFKDLSELFDFDRRLRELTFHYLIRAEATARTAISYCFSEAHRGPSDYLVQSSYCSEQEFKKLGKGVSYIDEVTNLIGILKKRAKNSETDFVVHYRETYGAVPLWVLSNDLTFGNLEHFFNLMKPTEKEAAVKAIARSTGRLGDKKLRYFSVERATVCLEVLVKFRNICAHDERIYCARVGGRKDVGYSKMVWMLERFLTEREFMHYIVELVRLFEDGLEKNKAIEHVLSQVGLVEMLPDLKKRFGLDQQPE